MATSGSCGSVTEFKEVTASGVNSHASNSATVFNYPVQPVDDTGRMLALGSVIGGLFDALLGGEEVGDALDAQNTWKGMLDNTMVPRGQSELIRVDSERAKLPVYETDLLNQLQDYRQKADTLWPDLKPINDKVLEYIDSYQDKGEQEFNYSDIECLDDAVEKLCEFVGCGYTPDYAGIEARARAEAEVQSLTAFAEACRLGNRYNTGKKHNTLLNIRLQMHSAALQAASAEREKERRYAFDLMHKMRFDLADWLEKTRLNRRELALKYDAVALDNLRERWTSFAKLYLDLESSANNLSENRWRAYAESAFKSYELGGQMLAAAMQAYQAFAASVRATARQNAGGGGIAGLIAALTAIFTVFSGDCKPKSFLGIDFYGRPPSCCTAEE